MKATHVQPVCLVCHSEALTADAITELDEHYPTLRWARHQTSEETTQK